MSAAYFYSSNGAFVADDKRLLLHIQHSGPLAVWSQPGTDFFRPLVSIILWFEHRVFGLNSTAYHSVNILLLLVASTLLACIVGKLDPHSDRLTQVEQPGETNYWSLLFQSAQKYPSYVTGIIAGSLFFVWPNHSEPVNWISCVGDLLSTDLMLACLLFFLCYRNALTRISAVTYAASFWIALVAALLAKETAIVMPFILLLAALFVAERKEGYRRWFQLVGEALVVGVTTAAYMLLRKHVLGDWIGGYGAQTHLHFVKPDLINKAYLNLSNVFLPVNKEIALLVGGETMKEILLYILFGAFLMLLRSLPGGGKVSKLVSSMVLVFLALLTFWVCHFVLLSFVPGLDEMIPDSAKLGLLAVAILVALWRLPNLSQAANWLGKHGAITASILGLLGWTDWRLAWLPPGDQNLILLGVAFGFFVTRPQNPWNADMQRNLAQFAVFVACCALALLPALTLSIKLNGESQRFSYMASAFGLVAATLWFQIVRLRYSRAKTSSDRRTVGAPLLKSLAKGALLLALEGILFTRNEAWRSAGQISSSLNQTVEMLSSAQRIFVLSGPDTIDGAFVLRGGIKETAALLGLSPEIHSGTVILDELEGDKVSLTSKASGLYLVQPIPRPGNRLYALDVQEYAEKDPLVKCTSTPAGMEVQLPPLSDSDWVIYYDGTRWITSH